MQTGRTQNAGHPTIMRSVSNDYSKDTIVRQGDVRSKRQNSVAEIGQLLTESYISALRQSVTVDSDKEPHHSESQMPFFTSKFGGAIAMWNEQEEVKYHTMETLSAVERKEFEELKEFHSEEAQRKRERTVFFGYVVIALISTLLISGAMNFDQWQSLMW